MKQNLHGKKTVGKTQKQENLAKKDVQSLGGETNWKERAMDREEWRNGCEMGWS
jgi:hypothetical protein